jgi:hypothetical protein
VIVDVYRVIVITYNDDWLSPGGLGRQHGDQAMTTSTKVIAGLALLLGASSFSLAHAAPPASVNDPSLYGGGSLGFDGGQNSGLQNSRHYTYGPDPLKGKMMYQSATVTSVNDPSLYGGGSIGFNGGQNSSLQNSRHYANGPDPLKGKFMYQSATVTSVNDPSLYGGGSLGFDGGQNSGLQNSRHYVAGPDPLKGKFMYPDYVEITVHTH